MTEAAQQALRRTMELYSNTTRFALACNRFVSNLELFFFFVNPMVIHYSLLILINIFIFFSSEKIIEPIQSRCAMLRYSKLSDPQVLAKLLIVCDKENIPYGDDGMEAIVFTAQGISNLKLL